MVGKSVKSQVLVAESAGLMSVRFSRRYGLTSHIRAFSPISWLCWISV